MAIESFSKLVELKYKNSQRLSLSIIGKRVGMTVSLTVARRPPDVLTRAKWSSSTTIMSNEDGEVPCSSLRRCWCVLLLLDRYRLGFAGLPAATECPERSDRCAC